LTIGGSSLPGRRRLRLISGESEVPFYGSDIPQQRFVGTCRLCATNGNLRLSHVVPKWAYRWMKLEGGVHGSLKEQTIWYAEQDGDKHYLLCDTCEQYLGEAERYLSLLARGTAQDLQRINVEIRHNKNGIPILHGVNTRLVMRGTLGILYKIHFSDSALFAKYKFDELLIRSLSKRIQNDNYPSHSIRLFATKWLAAGDLKGNPKAMMFPELIVDPDRPKVFDLLMGGWSWSLVLGNRHRGEVSQVIRNYYLSESEPWPIMVGDISWHRMFKADDEGPERMQFKHSMDRKIWDDIDLASLCPCGLGELDFAGCCMDRWVLMDKPPG